MARKLETSVVGACKRKETKECNIYRKGRRKIRRLSQQNIQRYPPMIPYLTGPAFCCYNLVLLLKAIFIAAKPSF